MGLKWRGVLRCGACGRPRGLGPHLCNPGGRKRRRHRVQNPVTWECPRCHRPRGLVHTCHPKSDFKVRRRRQATSERRRKRKAVRDRQAARRRQAAADRRAREKARKTAGRTARPALPRSQGHDYHNCDDGDCARYGCTAFRDGIEVGHGSGYAAGYAAAQADAGSGE